MLVLVLGPVTVEVFFDVYSGACVLPCKDTRSVSVLSLFPCSVTHSLCCLRAAFSWGRERAAEVEEQTSQTKPDPEHSRPGNGGTVGITYIQTYRASTGHKVQSKGGGKGGKEELTRTVATTIMQSNDQLKGASREIPRQCKNEAVKLT